MRLTSPEGSRASHAGASCRDEVAEVAFIPLLYRSPKWYDPTLDKNTDAMLSDLAGHRYAVASTHQSTSDAFERVFSLLGQGLLRREGVLKLRRVADEAVSWKQQQAHEHPFTVVLLHQHMWVTSEGRLKTYSCARRNDSAANKLEVIAEVRCKPSWPLLVPVRAECAEGRPSRFSSY